MDPYKLSAFTTFGQFNNFQPHPQLRGVFIPIPTQIKYHEPYSEDQAIQGQSIVGRSYDGRGESYDPTGEQSVNPVGTNVKAIGNRNRRRRGEPISLSDIRLQK